MPHKPVLTAWNESRRERVDLKPGERVASMEYDLLGDDTGPANMKPGRKPGWLNVFAEPDKEDREPEKPEGLLDWIADALTGGRAHRQPETDEAEVEA